MLGNLWFEGHSLEIMTNPDINLVNQNDDDDAADDDDDSTSS